MHLATRWSPDGFDAYARLFPSTPALPAVDDRTPRFAETWRALGKMDDATRRSMFAPLAGKIAVVLVRGHLGSSIPGYLVAPARALRELGVQAVIARSSVDGSVSRNAKMLGDLVRRDVVADVGLVFGGHGRGGLEAMTLVTADGQIAARTRALLVSQAPRGPSPVLETTLLTRDPTARALEKTSMPCPVLHTASWSRAPTRWLGSSSQRIGEIAPGRAHDGQFFLGDLVWPGKPHLLLPDLDHVQPAMGGHGFDHVRYWLATIALTMELPT